MNELSTKNFTALEFRCKCPKCNREVPHKMDPLTVERLQAMRDEFGAPIVFTSAYRCSQHPVEARKAKPGQHNLGRAVDISVGLGQARARLLALAFKHGFTAVGWANSFIHIDDRGNFASWQY